MSYDLYLLTPDPSTDPAERYFDLAEAAEESGVRSASAARNRRIAEAIGRAAPRLGMGADDQAPTVQQETPDGDAAHEELVLADQESIEVVLGDEIGTITFPYWDSLDPDVLWRDIGTVAASIGAESGWAIYDPQLEEWLDVARDRERFGAAFDRGREQIRRIVAEGAGVGGAEAAGQGATPPRPSLWRRLFRRS